MGGAEGERRCRGSQGVAPFFVIIRERAEEALHFARPLEAAGKFFDRLFRGSLIFSHGYRLMEAEIPGKRPWYNLEDAPSWRKGNRGPRFSARDHDLPLGLARKRRRHRAARPHLGCSGNSNANARSGSPRKPTSAGKNRAEIFRERRGSRAPAGAPAGAGARRSLRGRENRGTKAVHAVESRGLP